MFIVDEPVRGSIPPAWWWSLPGLERIRALARGYIPQPPLCRLLGIRPGHVGPGSGTWTMPATAHLMQFSGELEISLLIDAALQGVAMTVLGPGQTLFPATIDTNHFRPMRSTRGKYVARGRVLNASRFFTFTELHVEDSEGRQVMQAVSQAEICRVEPDPPPAPANLAPIEEPSYASPDPYLRSVPAENVPLAEYEDGETFSILQRATRGNIISPYHRLMGERFVETASGRLRVEIPASEWFCLFSRTVSPGAILSLIKSTGAGANQTNWKKGHSFVGLSNHCHFLGPVQADGRPMRVESGYAAETESDVRTTDLRDADGRLIAQGTGILRWVDSAKRERPAVAKAKRMLCTLLFTDIVGSTQHAERLGDQKWHALLDEQRKKMRAEITRCNGTEIDTAGDGFFVRFDSPADALDCAVAAINAVKPLGIDIRAGVHTGECEVTGRNYAGMAVHMGARIMSTAGPGEILVSSTVKDLTMGSGRRFEDRGDHELKGVPGKWRLHALV